MTKRFLILILFTCACIVSQAQVNLVKNPSFEQYTNCPEYLNEISYAAYWNGVDTSWHYGDPLTSMPAACLPEYCNTCSTNASSSIPSNGRFYHYPRTGNGMASAIMFYDNFYITTGNYYQDYLQGQLSSHLVAGQSYCVTYFVVNENHSGYAINHIDAYLDDGTIDTSTNCGHTLLEFVPQIQDTGIINDTLNWVKIQGSFVANGTEKYITIGNFHDTSHTEHIAILPGAHTSNYLIDDVSVIASNATAYAGPDVAITVGCSAHIGADSSGDGMPCYWYVLGGTAPIDSGGSIIVRPTDTTTYVVAMDLCGTVTYDTVTVNVLPCAGPPAVSFTDTGSHTLDFTYTGIAGCTDSIRWDFGDGSTSTLTDPVHTYSATGTYSVCATVYTYCGSNSACNTVGVVTEGTSPQPSPKEREPLVYPSPAGGSITVANAMGGEVRMFDIMGVEVKRLNSQKVKEVIDISHLSDGVYIVQVVSGNGERKCVRVVHTSQ